MTISKINWNEITKDRNDEWCLNCESCYGGQILGYRKIDDGFSQRAHLCIDCQNIVITIIKEDK